MLVLFLCGSMAISTATAADEPKKDATKEQPPQITAADLQAAFKADKSAAVKKYSGKPIRVTGALGPVKVTKDGSAFTTVGGIPCTLSNDGQKAAADLKPGQKVVAAGDLIVADGGTMAQLEVRGCGLEPLPEDKKDAAKEKRPR